MGSNCACLNSGTMLTTKIDHNGNPYKELVCARCHKDNHTSHYCYASRYSDGSVINKPIMCYDCGNIHKGHCKEEFCIIL